MPKYNPNSIWGSKEKQYIYDPKEYFDKPKAQPRPERSAEPSNPSNPRPESPRSEGSPTPSRVTRFQEPKEPFHIKNPWLWWFGAGVVIILGSLVYIFLILPSSLAPSIGLQFSKPDQVLVGDPFTLTISYLNTSSNILKNAALSVQLPTGVSFVGQAEDQRVMEQNLGDLGPNSLNKQDFTLIVTGNPASIEHVTAAVTYGNNSKTQYESDGSVDIRVGDSAAILTFTAPTNIFSGQDFDTVVNYRNNTSKNITNAILQLQYPPNFTFTKSTVAPTIAGGSTWNLGTLPAGASGSFTVTGQIIGPEQSRYSINGTITADVSGQTYAINTQAVTFVISSSPLSVAISLNNQDGYLSKLSDGLNYTLTYTNNSDVTFQGISIKATLTGAMFDFTSLQSAGYFDSRSNTITWYAANTPALSSLAPRESGSVTFQIQTKSAFPIRLLSDKNYSLKVNAQISSPTVPSNTAGNGTISVAAIENKIGGKIVLASKGYWHDPSVGFTDTGPYPPKVNQTTQYSVHWRITNYSTDAQNVTVSAYLQSGTTYTGQVKSNVSSTPVYDASTGLITWTIPFIAATQGVISAPAEVIFQVSNTPAVNQVGTAVTLVGPVTLQATDAFTGAALAANAASLTTDLPDDTNIGLSAVSRRVVP